MKKIIAFILCALCLLFCACSLNEISSQDNNSSTNTIENSSNFISPLKITVIANAAVITSPIPTLEIKPVRLLNSGFTKIPIPHNIGKNIAIKISID